MKCPKCGYVSFNYLDQCKKCGKDLVLFKEEKHIWGIKPGNLKLYPLPSEDSPLESLGLPAEGEMGSAIITAVAAVEPSPILEESPQEIASQLEAIETPPEEPLEAAIEVGEEITWPSEAEEEIVLEEELAGLDISFFAGEGGDKDLETLALGVSDEPEEESEPLLLLEEMEQDIQLDLEAEEEPIILLEEKDQPEEGEILLDLEDSIDRIDELELLLDEDEEEETK